MRVLKTSVARFVRHLRALGVAVAFVVPSVARGAERRIAIEATNPDCVSLEQIATEVGPSGVQIDPAAPVRLRVDLTRTEQGITIEVAGENEGKTLLRRSFTASSCAEALDALALVVTLAADESTTLLAVEHERDTTTANTSPPSVERASVDHPAHFVADVALLATSFAEGQAGARASVGFASRRWLLPSAHLGVGGTLPRTVSGGGGDAALTWAFGRAAMTPLGIPLGSRGLLGMYGALEVGAVFAAGSGPPKTDSRARPWLAASAGLEGRVDLSSRWFLGLEAGANMPLIRDNFVFLSGGAVYRVPAVAVESAIAVGMHFP